VHLVAVHALCAAIDAALPPAAARVSSEPPLTRPWLSRLPLTRPLSRPPLRQPQRARTDCRADRSTRRRSAAIGPRVVVVGDVLLDRDLFGHIERIAPDAPVPVVDLEAVRESPGGAGLTALLCAASGVSVTLVAPIAVDDAGTRLRARLSDEVELVALPAHR
jgi:hypothetical protein